MSLSIDIARVFYLIYKKKKMKNALNHLIKDLREESSLSQKEVAEYLSIDPSAYSKIERAVNYLSVDKYKRIVELFGISENDINSCLTIYNHEDFNEKESLQLMLLYVRLAKAYYKDIKEDIKGCFNQFAWAINYQYERHMNYKEMMDYNSPEDLIDGIRCFMEEDFSWDLLEDSMSQGKRDSIREIELQLDNDSLMREFVTNEENIYFISWLQPCGFPCYLVDSEGLKKMHELFYNLHITVLISNSYKYKEMFDDNPAIPTGVIKLKKTE